MTHQVVRLFLALLTLLISMPANAEPVGSAFTYQGELKQGESLAHGTYDFQFALHDNPLDGISMVGPLSVENLAVSEGLFNTELDFGAAVFDGSQLDVEKMVTLAHEITKAAAPPMLSWSY